jgi:CheY-like chemotaxis protein
MMPRMNGAAAAKALRARGIRAPIVLMSGYAEEELLTRGLTAEADGFLKKPFLAADLALVVSDAVRHKPLA